MILHNVEKRSEDEEREKKMQRAVLDIKNKVRSKCHLKGTSYQEAATGMERISHVDIMNKRRINYAETYSDKILCNIENLEYRRNTLILQ